MRTIEWKDGLVLTIDQSELPLKEVRLRMKTYEEIASSIEDMKIRGAPLIGAAAAYGLALTTYHSKAKTREEAISLMEECAERLRRTRPTAVNLFWAIDRVMRRAYETLGRVDAVNKAVIEEAKRIADEDVEANRSMGRHGAVLIKDGDTVMTHCNAGALATVDYGTALGVIRAAWEEGKKVKVIATETRPKLQGARLTAYELKRDGIPVILITDNMVGYVMSKGLVDLVIVGADRVVKDAVINKIGTYTIAVLSKEHGVPFYVAAPLSTFDLKNSSKEVTIEERSAEEVKGFRSQRTAPEGVEALNPAFDITPMKYITAIVTERGILKPSELSFKDSAQNLF